MSIVKLLCRIKVTGVLPEDAEFTPVVPTSSSTPDLAKKSGTLEFSFYRAMHFSAKRGIAIACRLSVRLSVCLSVCNVGEL